MTTDIIDNINLGTVMPFFAFNINTSHICTEDDVNQQKFGCILSGQPGYIDDSGTNDGNRWMKFSSIQSNTIEVDENNSDQSSEFPAALSQPSENDYTLLPTSWITGNKDNNGSTVCLKFNDGKLGFCGECSTNTPVYQPVCTNKITAINTAGKMTNIKKPWYSKHELNSYMQPAGDNSWPTSDPRGMCPSDETQITSVGPTGIIQHSCKDSGHCSTIKNTCVGTTTGNVELRGVKELNPISGSNQDVDIGIAGVIVNCNDVTCTKGGSAVNEWIQNVGGKFIKQINSDCFDPTKIVYKNAYYGIPSSVALPDNNIQNEPSALDTPNWTNQPTNGFDFAVNYTEMDLFASNNYIACEGRGGQKECSYAGGIGTLLYMPPVWPDLNKLTNWINTFKNNSIGIKTKSINPIKLPDFLIPWVLTMATINMMPRYMTSNLFGMYKTPCAKNKNSLNVQYSTLHQDDFGILTSDLSDAINNIKTFTNGLLQTAFTAWNNDKGLDLFNTLDQIVTETYYGSNENFLITSSGERDMNLLVTLPIDMAIEWLNDDYEGLSQLATDSLGYFFGESKANMCPASQDNLDQTKYNLYKINNVNYITFTYNNGTVNIEKKTTDSFDFKNQNLYSNKVNIINNFTTNIYYSIQLEIQVCEPSIMTLAYIIMTNPGFGGKATCPGQAPIKGCGNNNTTFPTVTEDCINTLLSNEDYTPITDNIARWCSNYTDSYPRSDGIEKYILNDKSNMCLCYNSHLTSTDSVDENELSLCFSKYCSLDSQNNLRAAYNLDDSKCQDDVCASLKALFKNEVLPPNLEDIDTGRVQKLCKFNPYDRNYSYNTKILFPVLNVAVFLICLFYTLLRKNEELLTILVMIILILTILSGFILASSPAACVKRSNLPQKRISKCITPIGIELPEEYCGQKVDYCESIFDTTSPNQGCPSKCCPLSTGCSNKCTKDPKTGKITAEKGNPTFYTRRNVPVIILSSLLFVGTAIALGVLNFKLSKNNKTQYIVSAIILLFMLGLLIKNIVGEKTVASIYGCNATD